MFTQMASLGEWWTESFRFFWTVASKSKWRTQAFISFQAYRLQTRLEDTAMPASIDSCPPPLVISGSACITPPAIWQDFLEQNHHHAGGGNHDRCGRFLRFVRETVYFPDSGTRFLPAAPAFARPHEFLECIP